MKMNCLLPGRLDGKTVSITGGNSGIGLETTAELARRGARVIMLCRNKMRAEKSKEQILDWYGVGRPTATNRYAASQETLEYLTPVNSEQLVIEIVDLQSYASIRACAERLNKDEIKIDILINNAGIMACPYAVTVDGNESQMGTNYLGHFLLTQLLLPSLRRQGTPARIINVSAVAQELGKVPENDLNINKKMYRNWQAFRNSKLATVIYAKELALRLKHDGIIAVSLNPGHVRTSSWSGRIKFFKLLAYPWMKNPWEGAQTTIFCALANDLESGGFYEDCQLSQCNPLANDPLVRQRLWKLSVKATGLEIDQEVGSNTDTDSETSDHSSEDEDDSQKRSRNNSSEKSSCSEESQEFSEEQDSREVDRKKTSGKPRSDDGDSDGSMKFSEDEE